MSRKKELEEGDLYICSGVKSSEKSDLVQALECVIFENGSQLV